MNKRTAAAIGLRLIGLLLVLESLLVAVQSLCGFMWFLSPLPLGMHRRIYAGGGATPDLDLHDTYYAFVHSPFFVNVAPGLLTGCALLFFSKPLSRLVARNLPED